MQPNVASALVEAANLLLVGMVVVFLFLSMLIGAITLIAWLNKRFPDPSIIAEASQVTSTQNNQVVAPNIVAAISAAIHQHRRSH